MQKDVEIAKWIAGVLTMSGAFLFGAFDKLIMALLTFIAIDFATGILKAVHNKELSSEVMFKGGIKKVGMMLIVAVANIADDTLSLNGVVRNSTIGYFMANEGISMIENWNMLGLPFPQKLKDVLEQLKNGSEKKDLK